MGSENGALHAAESRSISPSVGHESKRTIGVFYPAHPSLQESGLELCLLVLGRAWKAIDLMKVFGPMLTCIRATGVVHSYMGIENRQ